MKRSLMFECLETKTLLGGTPCSRCHTWPATWCRPWTMIPSLPSRIPARFRPAIRRSSSRRFRLQVPSDQVDPRLIRPAHIHQRGCPTGSRPSGTMSWGPSERETG